MASPESALELDRGAVLVRGVHPRADANGGTLARIESVLLRPVDIAWLVTLRALFGAALAVSMGRLVAYGWVDTLLVQPRFKFHYWGFAWVEPLAREPLHALVWSLVGLAIAVAAGCAYRVTAPLFAAGLTYVQLIDVSNYLNHYYLAGLLAWLLAFAPANRAWSVDAWLRGRTQANAPRREGVARGWLVVFRVQVAVVYIFAGVAKAHSDWLEHGQPLGTWLGARTDVPLLGRLFTVSGVPLAMSWFGFVFDSTIVLWLSWHRSRPWAYAVLVVFHVLTRVLFDIGMFPVIMSLAALVFFSPGWPRRLVGLLPLAHGEAATRPTDAPAAETAAVSGWRRAGQRLALALGALHCLVQVLLPLRSHLYGGNVLWHERGMRFSWRVMVRAKGGATTFLVRQRSTGRTFHVSPREYLAPFQDSEMSSQPDLVLQLAHHIARDFEGRNYGPVEVRADSLVSLDGRRAIPMIDPAVDLTTIPDGIGRADWILPGPTDPPPRTRPVL